MNTSATRPSLRGRDFSQELQEKGWYHSFELPDGTKIEGFNSLEILQGRWSRFPIPADLTGKRVLDTGAWDGWFSFEAERRGATVTAIDCVEVPHFLEIHRQLDSRVDYRILDFYELNGAGLGVFDYVLFLGILYHLKHPLLALEIMCELTTDTAIVESFVTDGDTWREHTADVPSMEFYETDELGNQLDNWIGPSVSCLLAMCRAAGFARVELLYAKGFNAGAVCYRRWETVADPPEPAPEIDSVANSRTYGINFSSRRDEYISCWFRTARESVRREELRFEVGGFGVPALYVKHEADGKWMANFRLPPGLGAGWHEARLRFDCSDFGDTRRVAVDIPPRAATVILAGACDGTDFHAKGIRVGECGWVSSWVKGLPENADRDNVRVLLDSARLVVDYVGAVDPEGHRQVNAVIPGGVAKGSHELRVQCAGVSSEPLTVEIV